MKITKQAPLRKRNTFGLEATADTLYEIENELEIAGLVTDGVFKQGNCLILGGGSNVLLLKLSLPSVVSYIGKGIRIVEEDQSGVLLSCSAGEKWDDVVAFATGHSLWGIENLSLIPGTAGAAPIQNIGAYGQEVSNTVAFVRFCNLKNKMMQSIAGSECNFGYRDSIFKRELRGKIIITEIGLRLTRIPSPNLSYAPLRARFEGHGEPPSISEIRSAVIAIRESKLADPEKLGNAGSFFKNPVISPKLFAGIKSDYPKAPFFSQENGVKVPAGWLIETAGWKGQRSGNVSCYEKQALVLVNYGGATGKEIADFAKDIRASVEEQFGIRLEFEVNFIE